MKNYLFFVIVFLFSMKISAAYSWQECEMEYESCLGGECYRWRQVETYCRNNYPDIFERSDAIYQLPVITVIAERDTFWNDWNYVNNRDFNWDSSSGGNPIRFSEDNLSTQKTCNPIEISSGRVIPPKNNRS